MKQAQREELWAQVDTHTDEVFQSEEVGNLILRIDGSKGRLYVNDAEYHMALTSLNALRNRRIATGGYTDAVDDALIQFSKAHKPLFGCCRS